MSGLGGSGKICSHASRKRQLLTGELFFTCAGKTYLKREVLNLARFISVMKTRPLAWRLAHPYLVADRFEVCPTCP